MDVVSSVTFTVDLAYHKFTKVGNLHTTVRLSSHITAELGQEAAEAPSLDSVEHEKTKLKEVLEDAGRQAAKLLTEQIENEFSEGRHA